MPSRRLLSWLAFRIQMLRCAQWADTCPKCEPWKAERKAKAHAKVERLTRPRES